MDGAFYDRVVHRPDDAIEILACYRGAHGKVIPNSLKKGLGRALARFDEYQLAKYRKDRAELSLVDVVNLVHPPATEALGKLVKGPLAPAETWETKLTQAGAAAENDDDLAERKREAWSELIRTRKIGYFALLRNLRNVLESAPEAVDAALAMLRDEKLIRKSLVLPFRFQTALDAVQASHLPRARPHRHPPPTSCIFARAASAPMRLRCPAVAIVLTDEMATLLGHDTDVLLGVLAHELGHVHHRHGTAQLVQVTLLGALSALVLGDVGSWVTSVPVLLGQAGYSRQAEREADAHAARVLAAAGVSPAVMVRLFDVLAAREGSGPQAPEAVRTLGIAIASHPDDGERRRFFSEAALSLPGR